jgi:hypothetical protein
MATTPPPVGDAEFLAVDTINEDDIKARFSDFLRSLHAYLNQLPCLRDVQKTRRRWKSRTAETEAFGNFATDPEHWYTFHHGGRNEAQFNVGLQVEYLRVGLGFEFTLKKGGDPTAVHLAYPCFVNVIRAARAAFERFVADNRLEVEWSDSTGDDGGVIETEEAITWLLNPPAEPRWIFIGRLLRREEDAAILADRVALGGVMERVLCGFRLLWEQTEVLAHT